MDTEFDKIDKELEESEWLNSEPVIASPGSSSEQDFDEMFSEIVAQAEASYESSKEAAQRENDEAAAADTSGREDPPGIQVTKRVNKRIGDIAEKIKKADVLQPDTLKDMFFGSRDDTSSEYFSYSDDDSDDDYDDEEQPTLFAKRPVYTADVKKDRLIFETEYTLDPDQAKEGYMLFYNEFVRKQNFKFTIMMTALSALLMMCALLMPKNGYMMIVFMFLCLAVIGIKWLGSFTSKRDAMRAAENVKNESYRLSFYSSRIIIKASELSGDTLYSYPPVMIRFEDIELKVIDYDIIYVLIFKKDYIYTVPKSALTAKMNSVFSEHLKNILGDDYCEFFTRRSLEARLERLRKMRPPLPAFTEKQNEQEKDDTAEETAPDKDN